MRRLAAVRCGNETSSTTTIHYNSGVKNFKYIFFFKISLSSSFNKN